MSIHLCLAALHDISLPPGHYDSPDSLAKQINATIASKKNKKNLIRFSCNEISKKITIKESQLTSVIRYKDTSGKMDERVVAAAGENKGLVKRASFTKSSKVVDMIGRIHSNIFFQEELLMNGISVPIRLVRSKDSFSLVSTDVAPAFKIKIVRARKVRISDSIYLAHAKALEHANATYPLRRVECKTFSITTGNYDAVQENLYMGQIPYRVIVGLIDTDAFNGSFARIRTTSRITKSWIFC